MEDISKLIVYVMHAYNCNELVALLMILDCKDG